MGVLVIALVIDVMKPASLGFTVPGMISEYQVPKKTVSSVPFFALAGTVSGSLLWGWIADLYGRKASILLSAVMTPSRNTRGVAHENGSVESAHGHLKKTVRDGPPFSWTRV